VTPEVLAPKPPERVRVHVANPADGGVFYWLGKLVGFMVLAAFALSLVGGGAVYRYFSESAPPVPICATTRRRRPASRACTPPTARCSASSRRSGARPSRSRPFRNRSSTRSSPSRITTSTTTAGSTSKASRARSGRTSPRRLRAGCVDDHAAGREAVPRRGEVPVAQGQGSDHGAAPRGAILEERDPRVYLNQIYLGAGAWGVAAAAQRYFQKDLSQLTLAESALIAGLAKAPTKFSPMHDQKLARDRRDVVLDKMQTYGYATAADVAKAKAEPIALNMYRDVFPDRMPYYAESVRRYVNEKYKDGLFEAG